MPKSLINRVQALIDRDESIARAFKSGMTMTRLASKYSVPLLAVEDIIRTEMLTHPTP